MASHGVIAGVVGMQCRAIRSLDLLQDCYEILNSSFESFLILVEKFQLSKL